MERHVDACWDFPVLYRILEVLLRERWYCTHVYEWPGGLAVDVPPLEVELADLLGQLCPPARAELPVDGVRDGAGHVLVDHLEALLSRGPRHA